jgi:DNA-binding winged helix-turn-helix (wHTH) protein/TolB-like protein/tetratricopeptide (TPR) repeat protein
MLARRFYQFGPFRIDAEKRVLLREGEAVPLKPKAFDALLVLVQHHGEVLEKDVLMDMLWPDSDVEESNLPQHISTLRKTLGEGPNERRYIVTVPGRGYRFAADVEEFDESQDLIVGRYTKSTFLVRDRDDSSDESGRSIPAPGIISNRGRFIFATIIVLAVSALLAYGLWRLVSDKPEDQHRLESQPLQIAYKSVAVLPFRHLGAEGDEYLGLGIADSLITRLSNLLEIKVRPTSAVLKYGDGSKEAVEVGRELGVETVLEGSIRRSGESLRVTVQLVRVEDGSPLWAEKFDERFTDIFKIEDSISGRVAERLVPKLTGEQKEILVRHHTDNIEAYQLFMKGRYFMTQRNLESIQKGIGYIQKAITIDQNYALAYAGLSQAYLLLPITSDVPSKEILPVARQAIMKALEIDDTLADAHVSLAGIKYWMEWDWKGSEEDCKRAIELNPNHPGAHFRYAHVLSSIGQHTEAIEQARRALEIDPVSPLTNLFLGQFLYQARQYDQAIEPLRNALEIAPNDWLARLNLGKVYVQQRKYGEAIAEFQRAREFSGTNTETIAVMGHALAVSGKRSEAQRVLDELKGMSKQRYVPPYNIAIVYVGLGEKQQALAWLEKAYEDRDVRLVFLNVEPKWDALRAEERFTDLIRRMGLAQ